MFSLWVRIDDNNVDWERSFSFPDFASLVHRLYRRLFSRLAHKYCSFLLAKRVYNLVARARGLSQLQTAASPYFPMFFTRESAILKWGESKEAERGRGERNFLALPLPPFLLSPSHLLKGKLLLLSPIFLCHKIKDGGYNNTNINKLSPTQNTPALQAISFKKLTCLQLLVKGYLKQTFWQRTRTWTIDSAGDWRVTLTWAGDGFGFLLPRCLQCLIHLVRVNENCESQRQVICW